MAVVTLGCARNEVDSEELAERLADDGWALAAEPEDADVILVNTCGFIEQAKRDSIDTLLGAAATGRPVVAVGCLAERYGVDLARELPEATVLGFDDYPDIAARLTAVRDGGTHEPHTPADRRLLLPITPVDRAGADAPGHSQGTGPRLLLRGPSQPVKLASGCDRRCTFCAIPSFRGSFISRRPLDVRAEVASLAADGVREVVLVSENSTSYGKDLGDLRLLESLLPELGSTGGGLEWVRVSYLQPAEIRPGLVQVIADTPGVARYFDVSFQHASGPVLRRMRRFGDAEAFLSLLRQIRADAPTAGVRSNFIVGFPGETEDDLEVLADFLQEAELDAIGVFGYSDEDGTEAVHLPDHVDEDTVADRVRRLTDLADALMEQRAESRVGEVGRFLVESVADGVVEGRLEHQGPEDAGALLTSAPTDLAVGDMVTVRVVGNEGVDVIVAVVP